MNTYKEFDEYLGAKDERPLCNNTRVYKERNGDISIWLHNTAVVTHHPNGSQTIRSGGWETVTTQNRINRFSGCYVGSNGAGRWDIHSWRDGLEVDSATFKCGVTISPRGSLQEHKRFRFAAFKRLPKSAHWHNRDPNHWYRGYFGQA